MCHSLTFKNILHKERATTINKSLKNSCFGMQRTGSTEM